jgi:hypothetical protein
MQLFSQRLYKYSTSAITAVVLIVFLLFAGFVLPTQNLKTSTGENASIPDLSLFYSSKDLVQMAQSYGPAGRAAYVQGLMEFDFLWPLMYGGFLSIALSWLFQHLLSFPSTWRLLNLLPLFAVLLDFLENICTAAVMGLYPQSPQWALFMAPLITPIKWLWIGCSVLVLAGGFLILLIQKLRPNQWLKK